MRNFKLYTIDGFNYTGEIDLDFYERQVSRKRFDTDAALVSANWDLQTLSNRYKRTPSDSLARVIRAQYQYAQELM